MLNIVEKTHCEDRTMSKPIILGWYKRIRVVKVASIKKGQNIHSIAKRDMEILQQ